MSLLPVFKGWTVDVRLNEFRKVDPGTGKLTFLPFCTEEGDKLLTEYVYTLDVISEEFRQVALNIL